MAPDTGHHGELETVLKYDAFYSAHPPACTLVVIITIISLLCPLSV